MNMTRIAFVSTVALVLAACGAMGGAGGPHRGATGGHGLVALKSPHSQADTLTRLEAQVRQRNLNVFARIDHAGAAQRSGMTLRPTEVMIFGNPQAGTPLMQCAQRAGIDLPMKALVWSDESGQTWLGYNEPRWLMHRHGGPDCPPAEAVGKALAAIAAAVVAK